MVHIARDRAKRIANASPAERRLWKQMRFLIQVHDEILLEGPHAIRYEIQEMVERNMRSVAPGLRVLLAADCKFGRCWDDVH
jgi:DNA polymerase I-like protein with 3'-5' exonuclease and polymerase domains